MTEANDTPPANGALRVPCAQCGEPVEPEPPGAKEHALCGSCNEHFAHCASIVPRPRRTDAP